ncbi:MAG: UDP-N-acetylenolpyruvoylglucosamine reductase [Treponema sp.]
MKDSIREIGENINKSHFFEGDIKYDEVMKNHTTMKVGGSAALFAEPSTVMAAAEVFALCSESGVPVFKVGGGSNLIVSDEGFEGAVVSTEKIKGICFKKSEEDSCLKLLDSSVRDLAIKLNLAPRKVFVECSSGVKMNEVSDFCAKYGITGMEKFAGLPGTVGGACYMNARCFEKSISEVISSVEYLDLSNLDEIKACLKKYSSSENVKSGDVKKIEEDSIVKSYNMNDNDWGYKHSPFMQKNSLVSKVVFSCVALSQNIFDRTSAALPEIQMLIKKQNDIYIQTRIAKGHFKAPSAGSVFKNNHEAGKPSGVLIDEAGLKGTVMGGAQVAPWHGNFIINNGNATAKDIYNLVNLVQRKVKEDTGFTLEPEVVFCGKGFDEQV